MNRALGLTAALLALGVAAISRDPLVLGMVWGASLTAQSVAQRSLPVTGPMSAAVAATLAGLQWIGGMLDPGFVLKSACLIVLLPALAGFFPWPWLGRKALLMSRGTRPVLFLLFTRHFAMILLGETRRAYVARRISAPRLIGPGGLRSLVWATSRVFERALVRAERFYVARVADGFPE